MAEARTFVVVGGGQAGAWIARTLRSEGFDGRILLIGEEAAWPYERPPLSKSVLLGTAAEDEGVLLTEAKAAELGVEAWLGAGARHIHREARRVICADGRVADYDVLFLATGSRARTLPFAEALASDRIHHLRTRADAARLKDALRPGGRLVVLGGGWIGLEVAASARKLGVEVVVLEAAPRVCARSLPPPVSAFLQGAHAANGVDLRVEARVEQVLADAAAVRVVLSDGQQLQADHLLIGVGASPNVELALDAGLEVDDGVVVDAAGRTSDPAIFAAGDVTAHFSRFGGRRVRLESWANAQSQAIVAARAALGLEVAYDEAPWFWSDQFDFNLQMVGFPHLAGDVLVKGSPAEGKGIWLMLDAGGRPIGAVAVNEPRELRTVRKALQAGADLDLSAWTPLSG